MNLSLRGRVTTSFILATLLVISISVLVFHFLNNLKGEIEGITQQSNKVTRLNDDIRITTIALLKNERVLLTKKPEQDEIDRVMELCDQLTGQLQSLDSLNDAPNVKKIIGQMQSYVDSLRIFLSKGGVYNRGDDGSSSIGGVSDRILDSFSLLQDVQYSQSSDRDRSFVKIITDTKNKMMIVLIFGFFFTILLALVVPVNIALPFKKIKDAVRELQDCNFDVSIYYNQQDEIGEIAQEMNTMIHSLKVFEELRAERISVENRKFDALANLSKRPVMVANAEGCIIYLNNRAYGLLRVQSEEIIGKEMSSTLVPEDILEAYGLAIKRRSKIENVEVKIEEKKEEEEAVEKSEELVESEVEEEKDTEPVKIEYLFNGYANVIPIRGKESSLDYYLMVLSTEVFT